jgi:predicted dithiol-disulfide oxidoreductase (DUF899 family)
MRGTLRPRRSSATTTMRHFWGAELGFGSADPGKETATEQDLMVLRNVLDLTPGGRCTGWHPSITY